MNMKKTKQLAALRLNRQGIATSKIAAKLGVSIRTIQRWLLAEAPLPSEDDQTQALDDSQASEPESGHELSTPSSRDSEGFDEAVASRTALRLMKLSEAAIGAVEDCLSNPYVKTSDKLKAAQIVGDWLGLGATPANFISITERVERTFSVRFEEDDSDDSEDDEEPEGCIVTTKVIGLPPPQEALDWMRQEEERHKDEIDQRRLARSLRSRLGNPPRILQDPENLA